MMIQSFFCVFLEIGSSYAMKMTLFVELNSAKRRFIRNFRSKQPEMNALFQRNSEKEFSLTSYADEFQDLFTHLSFENKRFYRICAILPLIVKGQILHTLKPFPFSSVGPRFPMQICGQSIRDFKAREARYRSERPVQTVKPFRIFRNCVSELVLYCSILNSNR